jgi:hypothetical protein
LEKKAVTRCASDAFSSSLFRCFHPNPKQKKNNSEFNLFRSCFFNLKHDKNLQTWRILFIGTFFKSRTRRTFFAFHCEPSGWNWWICRKQKLSSRVKLYKSFGKYFKTNISSIWLKFLLNVYIFRPQVKSFKISSWQQLLPPLIFLMQNMITWFC